MHHFLAAGKRERVLELIEEDLDLKDFDVIDAGYQNLYFSVLDHFQKAEVTDPRRWALILDEKGDISLQRGDAKAALAFYDDAEKIFAKEKDAERLLDLSWKRALAFEKLGKRDEARRICDEGLKASSKDGTARQRLTDLSKKLAAEAPKVKARARAA
jgi:tetratricopeptide (TPR) repeat protein